MPTSSTTFTWRRLLIGFAAAALILILAVTFREYARQSLAPGLLYLLWVSQRIFLSLPQAFWYSLFLLAALILSLRSLRQRDIPINQPAATNNRYFGRVEDLSRLAAQAQHSRYFAHRLERLLVDLLLESLGHEPPLTLWQTQEAMAQARGRVPAHVYTFLQQHTAQGNSGDLLAPVPNRLTTLTQRLRGRHQSSLSPTLREVIHYLEQQLEMKHD
ncbi:MAG: hypothetical protein KJ063_03575 [Anaerolineae bacterium]|nr:hypothetical protein [Anaerolineae bacterium]